VLNSLVKWSREDDPLEWKNLEMYRWETPKERVSGYRAL
jgi:hypothetical protein